MRDLNFFRGKRVFITGHTGFKGAWLSQILLLAGAEVTGYALPPDTEPSLFELLGLKKDMRSVLGDIRDPDALRVAYEAAAPEIVLHLAAQPLVRESYRTPRETYQTNVMGTVNLLECVRLASVPPVSVLNVTTDKVYENREWQWGYRENDPLDGFDPYSNSKSCSDLVTHCYVNSFLRERGIPVSTARAGNVIGGGDFARDRIVPDCVRAAMDHEAILVRNPYSVRPYQHVLDPLFAYLMIAAVQAEDPAVASCYNIGPDDCDCVNTGELAQLFCRSWGEGQRWESCFSGGPHEAGLLKLDCSKLKSVFSWKPRWHVDRAVDNTVEWYKTYRDHGDVAACVQTQLRCFLKDGVQEHA